jgi:hypothetical protein
MGVVTDIMWWVMYAGCWLYLPHPSKRAVQLLHFSLFVFQRVKLDPASQSLPVMAA